MFKSLSHDVFDETEDRGKPCLLGGNDLSESDAPKALAPLDADLSPRT